MAKITPFEMKQVIANYVQHESTRKVILHPEMGYVPSAVRESLERIDLTNPAPIAYCQIKAVKQCLSEKGVPFEVTFRTLHEIFYLLSRGYTYETAKKKARLVAKQADCNQFWNNFVKPEHAPILRAA